MLPEGDEPYQKFWQADSSLSRPHEGLGLGLYIAKRYMYEMGGDLTHSALDDGTLFEARFPALKGADIELCTEACSLSEATSVESQTSYSGKRCLIVDDGLDNQLLIELAMSQLGFECEEAENGQIAVDKLAESEYDLILMDMQMPVMDGVAATKFIRSELNMDKRVLPIIAITANDLEEHRSQCFGAGMNDFLTKPLDEQKLRLALQAVFSSRP